MRKIDELLEATESGDRQGVERLLDEDPDLIHSYGWWQGQTALHRAAATGKTELAGLLLARGAQVMARDDADNATPLHLAADGGHLHVARLLVDHGANVNATDDLHGWGPLGWAAIRRVRREVAEFLLGAGARPNVFAAIALDEMDLLRAMLPAGLEMRLSRFEHYEAPLHFAAGLGNLDMVRVLLDEGADKDQRNWIGLTPLAVAAFRRQSEVVGFLLQLNAELDLSALLGLGRLDAARARLAADPDVVRPGASYGRILHFCCEEGHTAAATALVEGGADVNARIDFWGNRVAPLHPAASYGHLAIVRLLVEHGADPAIRDDDHEGTPLEWAEHYERTDVVEYLGQRARE